MREIRRTIVSALIFSNDNKILMGRKDPLKGGVYSDCWHLPGGGVDEGETLERALRREVFEEVEIDVAPYAPLLLPQKGSGVSEKTLATGEAVLCRMEFNYFRIVVSDRSASEIKLRLNDDIIETRWFGMDELPHVQQIPGGKEFFQELELIKSRTASSPAVAGLGIQRGFNKINFSSKK